MNEDFPELQTLLRLKRYEAPPPDYFEDFLLEFHQRQRAELLRRPLWRIALDRFGNAFTFPALPVPGLAYAGTGAVALIAAAGLFTRGMAPAGGLAVAVAPAADRHIASVANAAPPRQFFAAPLAVSLAGREADEEDDTVSFRTARNGRAAALQPAAAFQQPRYLLDSQPVRYEPRSTTF